MAGVGHVCDHGAMARKQARDAYDRHMVSSSSLWLSGCSPPHRDARRPKLIHSHTPHTPQHLDDAHVVGKAGRAAKMEHPIQSGACDRHTHCHT